MNHWKLYEIETPDGSRSPVVLHSQDGESRVVLLALEPAQELTEHQVKEAAFILVIAGEVHVESGDESVDAVAGELFRFEPDERRSVSSDGGARLLLFFAPWPGIGHYRGDSVAGAAESRVSAS